MEGAGLERTGMVIK